MLRCCALMLDARLAEPSRDPPPSEDLPRFDGGNFSESKREKGGRRGDGKAKHTTRCESYWVGQRSTTSRSRQGRIETKRGFLLEPQPNRVFLGANSGQWTRILTWGRWFSEKPFALESRFSLLNGIIMMKKNKNKINRWFVKRIVFDRAALHSSASLAAPFAVPNRTGVIRWCFLGLFGASGGEPGPPATSFHLSSGPKKKRSFLLLLRIPADLKGGRRRAVEERADLLRTGGRALQGRAASERERERERERKRDFSASVLGTTTRQVRSLLSERTFFFGYW